MAMVVLALIPGLLSDLVFVASLLVSMRARSDPQVADVVTGML